MTYRQAIQIQIKALQDIYDNAEGLRDLAADEAKDAFNLLRRRLPELWAQLKKVDNGLAKEDAAYECKLDYAVHVDTNNV